MHAIGAQGRHMFWTSSGPFISNRPVRIVNLGRAWLGQDPNNRLLSVPLSAINRRWGLFVPETSTLPGLQVLVPIAASSTPAELTDLSLIDWFYDDRWVRFGRNTGSGILRDRARSYKHYVQLQAPNDPFYNPPEYDPRIGGIPHINFMGPSDYFGIQTSSPWGNMKLAVENAAVVLRQLFGYPFPSPISAMPDFWVIMAKPELQALVKAGKPLNPVETRVWITMNILSHYEEVSAQIAHHFEEVQDDAQDRARRIAIIKVGFGLVISIVFPALIASAFSAIQTVQSIQQQQEAADAVRDMENAAAAFDATDAAFAKEIRIATEYYEEKLAQAQGPAAPGGTAPGAPEEAQAGGIPTELLVGGGIAAAAATVALVFLGAR